MKYLVSIIAILFFTSNSFSQEPLLNDTSILRIVKEVMDAGYSLEVEKAEEGLSEIRAYSPEHPAVSFIEAFLIYWEYFPLYPDHQKADEFIFLMEDCIVKSENWFDEDDDELEAVFFDLFGRAFFIMFWADNGKSTKVFPHINLLYRHTLEGFDLMHEFNEFYFTTGLYNFYIESYAEKHPIYKPIVKLFKKGDKDEGLDQLKYCSENTVFLRVEAKLFLTLLYLNYENDIDSASVYASQLYREFPDNPYYAGKYLEILLLNNKFFFAPIVLEHLKSADGDFARMQYDLFMANYLEKKEKKFDEAINLYEKALSLSLSFGPFTNQYSAIAHMGMGRIYQIKGNQSKGKSHLREAKKYTSYEYILDDR